MLIKALLIGFFYWLGSSENALPITTGNGGWQLPLVGGTVCGIILGDVQTGVAIGSAVTVLYMGNVVIGGVMTADVNSVAYICTSLAILSGADENLAMALAATIGVLGAAIFTAYESIASIFYAAGDKAIAKGDIKAMKRAYIVLPQFVIIPLRFGLAVSTVLLGAEYAADLLAAIPESVLHMASVLGALLPAVGLSILLAYTLKDMKMLVFFFLGLMAVTFAKFNIVAVAVLGVCLAVSYYIFTDKGDSKIVEDEL